MEALDELVVDAVVLAYLEAPTETNTEDADVAALAEVHMELAKARAALTKLNDLYLTDDSPMTKEEHARRLAPMKEREATAIEALERLTAHSVHLRMLVGSRDAFLVAVSERTGELRTAGLQTPERDRLEADLRKAWSELDLDEQRKLVEANLLVLVKPASPGGKTLDRVRVVNRVTGRVMNAKGTSFVVVPPLRDEPSADEPVKRSSSS
jgi:hypothetical protein